MVAACIIVQTTTSFAQQYSTIRGKCTSQMVKDVKLFSAANAVAVQHTATAVAADGTFAFMMSLPEDGFYYLSCSDNNFSRIYIKKGEQINVVLNDGHFSVEGNLSVENRVIDSCNKLCDSLKIEDRNFIYSDFFPLFDRINSRCHKVVNSSSSSIKESLRFHIEMDLLNAFISYVGRNQKSYISEEQDNKFYQGMVKKFPCSDDRVLSLPYGIKMLHQFFEYKSSYIVRNSSYDLDSKLSEIESNILKAEYILSQIDVVNYTSFCEYELKYHPFMCSDDQRRRLSLPANRPKCAVKEGERAPNFIAKDVDGKYHSMLDFKGKYVVIDFWATWCSPCKKEIPYLQKMEKYFENEDVVFVSISLDENIKKWKDYLANNKLGGVQLHVGSNENLPGELYVGTIPRFMIIGTDGNFVDSNALRPSDEKLTEKLKSLLRIKQK